MNQELKYTTIGKALKFKSGSFLSASQMDKNGKYPVFGGNGINGYHSEYLFEESKIVIGRVGAYCGNVQLTQPNSWITDNALYIEKKIVDYLDKYLLYLLRFNNLNQYASKSGQPLISEGRLKDIKIPLPSLSTQKKIAEILDTADLLRQKDKALIAKYNQLSQSLFLDMFGDPRINTYNFSIVKMESIANKITDGEHTTPKRSDKGYKLLSARNIKNGYLDFKKVDYVDEDEFNKIYKRCNPEKNDVLISCSGTIGHITVNRQDDPFVLVRSVALIKPKHEMINCNYLEYYLRSEHMQNIIISNSKSSSQANLFTGPIKNLPLILPPIILQNRFAAHIEQIEKQKQLAEESLKQSEALFQSLLQKAFTGELVKDEAEIRISKRQASLV